MPSLSALLKAFLETAIIVAAARSVQNAITTFNHYTAGTGKVTLFKCVADILIMLVCTVVNTPGPRKALDTVLWPEGVEDAVANGEDRGEDLGGPHGKDHTADHTDDHVEDAGVIDGEDDGKEDEEDHEEVNGEVQEET
ncbi:hypothetical protein TI39_contig361g00001 [Zymoseptoria brevis]|uniref:Uncharacterized protein n=1 Tax=Zymoseptoria brevis TaxID=1047168 RepID=A0A0F4GPM6_9PEZI|nr:hypothetical protein TI39_contig361g00001 [Zymoseptoria brevis]